MRETGLWCIGNASRACGAATTDDNRQAFERTARDRIGNSVDGVGRRSLTRLFRGTYGHWTFSYGLETSKNVLKAKGGGKTRSLGIVMGLTSVRKDDFLETRRGRIQRDGRCEFHVNNFALRWCKRPGYSRSYTGLNAIVRITRWFDHRSSSSSDYARFSRCFLLPIIAISRPTSFTIRASKFQATLDGK